MKTLFFTISLLLSGIAYSNPFILRIGKSIDTVGYTKIPNVIIDSLIFEAGKGRVCSKALDAQTEAVIKLQTSQLADGVIIKLKESEVSHLEEVISAMQKDFTAVKTIKDEKIHTLKVKIRKLTVMLIGETGLVVLLVVLLL